MHFVFSRSEGCGRFFVFELISVSLMLYFSSFYTQYNIAAVECGGLRKE
jgi:hypothetical protein